MEMIKYLQDCFASLTHHHFWSLFGVSLQCILVLWVCLQQIEDELMFTFQPCHLCWTLCFLKTYPSSENGSSFWKVDAKTYRFYIWWIVVLLFCYLDTVSYNKQWMVMSYWCIHVTDLFWFLIFVWSSSNYNNCGWYWLPNRKTRIRTGSESSLFW